MKFQPIALNFYSLLSMQSEIIDIPTDIAFLYSTSTLPCQLEDPEKGKRTMRNPLLVQKNEQGEWSEGNPEITVLQWRSP